MSIVKGDQCIDMSLKVNKWSTEDEIADIDENSKKTLLINFLHQFYDGSVHSTIDLNLRSAVGEKGKLHYFLECLTTLFSLKCYK